MISCRVVLEHFVTPVLFAQNRASKKWTFARFFHVVFGGFHAVFKGHCCHQVGVLLKSHFIFFSRFYEVEFCTGIRRAILCHLVIQPVLKPTLPFLYVLLVVLYEASRHRPYLYVYFYIIYNCIYPLKVGFLMHFD